MRKRQRVDSEAEPHLKKLRAWANEWPIRGRAVGTLEVFMIVKAMEDKDRADRGRKFWCWSEFRSFKQTKGLA